MIQICFNVCFTLENYNLFVVGGKVCFIYIRYMIPHTKKNIILTSAKLLGASVF